MAQHLGKRTLVIFNNLVDKGIIPPWMTKEFYKNKLLIEAFDILKNGKR